jgi:predicted metalloprotease with PDZ domain
MKCTRVLRLAIGFFLFVVAAGPARAAIDYSVSFDHPEKHTFQVTMIVPVQGQDVVIAMPAWNALYQIRDFSRRVRNITALCPAATAVPLLVEPIDKQTWRVVLSGPCQPDGHDTIQIRYSVEWNDPGPFDSQLSDVHAFVNLAEILMYVPDRRAEDAQVHFLDVPSGWKLLAELSAGPGPNSFAARSYDTLVDAPVEAGHFDEFEFDNAGAHFRVVVDAEKWNRGKLEDALRRITASEIRTMGGAPFQEYTFFFHLGPDSQVGSGGMEHMNSTAIGAPSLDSAIGVAAHEFFHVWNVKRIRPSSLEPFDYSREQYSRALWFAEGLTDTYSAFTLERTGLWSKREFYDNLADQIETIQSRPAHTWQSAEESSLDAWYEKYPAYAAPDRSISYYDKGQILGVMLDLSIRDATDNHKSLDDVFRLMNDKFARQGRFYDEKTDIRAAIEQVAGKSFEDFFRRYVSGVDEIPYSDFLNIAGLELKSEAAYSISEISHATDRQRRIREGFLHGTTD